MRDRVKDGILLIVVDSNGVQLFNTELADMNASDYDAQRELGQRIVEGLPDSEFRQEEYTECELRERGL